jgi:2-oxoglutarate dehydrogenase E2 component (dihydrolipoamide succinyltransferase)
MHATKVRPVVVGSQILARPIMYVALTYDHRIIDGREAVLFLKKIKECIEEPQTILFDIWGQLKILI